MKLRGIVYNILNFREFPKIIVHSILTRPLRIILSQRLFITTMTIGEI